MLDRGTEGDLLCKKALAMTKEVLSRGSNYLRLGKTRGPRQQGVPVWDEMGKGKFVCGRTF